MSPADEVAGWLLVIGGALLLVFGVVWLIFHKRRWK